MNDPLDQLRLRFTGLRLISETGSGQLYAGQDFTGAEVTVAVLSDAAAADPTLRSAFSDAVWRHSPGAVPEAQAVYAADLHAGRPWAAIRTAPGRPGAEQLFAGLGEAAAPAPPPFGAPAGTGSPSAIGSPVVPPSPPPPTAPAYPPPTAPAYPPPTAPAYPPPTAPAFPPPTAPAFPPPTAPAYPPPTAPAYPSPAVSGYPTSATPAYPSSGPAAAYPPPAAPASPPGYGQPPGYNQPDYGYGQPPGYPAGAGMPPAGPGQPGRPKSPWPWLIGVGAAVLALVVVAGVVVAAARLLGDGDVDRPITLPPPTAPNPPPAPPAEPPPPSSGEPELRDLEPISVVGPTFGADEETFTMAFGDWPFAFRTPPTWGCVAGSFDPIPEALVWTCIDEEDSSSGERVNVMLWECATSCTGEEQEDMISRWLDDPEDAERRDDPPLAYVEYEENVNGNWAIDLSHFGGAGGDLRWHIGIYAEAPPDDRDNVQKIVNDIITQAA